jgi:hypothetical protein
MIFHHRQELDCPADVVFIVLEGIFAALGHNNGRTKVLGEVSESALLENIQGHGCRTLPSPRLAYVFQTPRRDVPGL